MEAKIKENSLIEVAKAAELIEQGKVLVVSGADELLQQLPKGNWIGGTTPYFYLKGEYGRMDKTKLLVTDFSEYIDEFRIETVTEQTIEKICVDGFANGIDFLILPAMQKITSSFALHSPKYENLYTNPLYGVVSGRELSEFTKGIPSKTYNGFLG